MSELSKCWKLVLASSFLFSEAIATRDGAFAQITPDATLPNNSQVATEGNTSIINGGTTAGSNLFHSFEQFSVLRGRTAFFNNNLEIQNIISRVTGSSISTIDGLIKANGTANLFLLNPNGIVFGRNASLNIGGSFVGSTASSINFADTQFSAATPQTTSLLSVSVPLGLQFGETRGDILNQSRNSVGLQVLPGKTLALVGGNVNLDGGSLSTENGRIELGGVAEPATVGLNVDSNNLSLNFPVGVRRADVTLTNGAQLNVSGIISGRIAINAQNLNIFRGSRLLADIKPGLAGNGTQRGEITLNATEAIVADNSMITTNVLPNAVGNGGDINITTGSLTLTNGAQVTSSTLSRGKGNAGNVTINARDTVSLDGVSGRTRNISRSGIFSRIGNEAVGNGGNINIRTGALSITNGAQVSATTGGLGNAGSVTIKASDLVTLDGDESRVAGRVEDQAVGNGGLIDIEAKSIFLTDGARFAGSMSGRGKGASIRLVARDTISFDGQSEDGQRSGASSSIAVTTDPSIRSVRPGGVGDGGDIEITTGSLFIGNGAELDTSTFGQGNAGSVRINARDTVSIDGVGIRNERVIASRVSSSAEFGAIGNAGQVNIKAGLLSVTNGGEVNVRNISSQGLGDAGELKIVASKLFLDAGRLTALITTSGNGGNIDLQVQDLILMRGGSLISAEARRTGDGGNVRIGNSTNAPLIVASPAGNNDIIAKANQGQGGEINIFTQGIFGLAERNPTTPQTSDINASSEIGVNGTVEINSLNVDPSEGLVSLPAEIVDASQSIATGCGSGAVAVNKFTITGRGGLPPTPREALASEQPLADLGTIVQSRPVSGVPKAIALLAANQIVEAQGWLIGNDGEVVLTGSSNVTSKNYWLSATNCYIP